MKFLNQKALKLILEMGVTGGSPIAPIGGVSTIIKNRYPKQKKKRIKNGVNE